jgi:hypothetical protein
MDRHDAVVAAGAHAEGVPERIVKVGVKHVGDGHGVSVAGEDEAVVDVAGPSRARHLCVSDALSRNARIRPLELAAAAVPEYWRLHPANLDPGRRMRSGAVGHVNREMRVISARSGVHNSELMPIEGSRGRSLDPDCGARWIPVSSREADRGRCRDDIDAVGVGQLSAPDSLMRCNLARRSTNGLRCLAQDVEPVKRLHHRHRVSALDGFSR